MTLTDLFLVILAAAWLVALWPAAVSARRRAPLFTAERWRRRMQLIAPRRTSAGRWVVAPPSSGASDRTARRALRRRQKRRKQLLVALVALVPLSAVPAAVRGGVMWDLHLASYALVALYVVLLVEARRRRQDSMDKVRSLASRRSAPRPVQRHEEHPARVQHYEEGRA